MEIATAVGCDAFSSIVSGSSYLLSPFPISFTVVLDNESIDACQPTLWAGEWHPTVTEFRAVAVEVAICRACNVVYGTNQIPHPPSATVSPLPFGRGFSVLIEFKFICKWAWDMRLTLIEY